MTFSFRIIMNTTPNTTPAQTQQSPVQYSEAVKQALAKLKSGEMQFVC